MGRLATVLSSLARRGSTGRHRSIDMHEPRILTFTLSHEQARAAIVSPLPGLLAVSTKVTLRHDERVLLDLRVGTTGKRAFVRAQARYAIPGGEGPLLWCARADLHALGYLLDEHADAYPRRHRRFPLGLRARLRFDGSAYAVEGSIADLSACAVRFVFASVCPPIESCSRIELLEPHPMLLPKLLPVRAIARRDGAIILASHRRVPAPWSRVRWMLRRAAETGVLSLPLASDGD